MQILERLRQLFICAMKKKTTEKEKSLEMRKKRA